MLTYAMNLCINALLILPATQDIQQPIPEVAPQNCHSSTENPRLLDDLGTSLNAERNLSGHWQLQWSDSIESAPTSFPHSCTLQIKEIDSVITGNFVGPVAGRHRDAAITGELEGQGSTRILVLQQRERGYVCSYQAIDNGGAITGVWHDTQNRSGTFKLLKYQ